MKKYLSPQVRNKNRCKIFVLAINLEAQMNGTDALFQRYQCVPRLHSVLKSNDNKKLLLKIKNTRIYILILF